MICATCEQPNPDGARRCSACSAVLEMAAPADAGLDPASASKGPEPEPLGTVLRALAAAPPISMGDRPGPLLLPPGSRIGQRYEIVRLLGKGGMGHVYQAHDVELRRDVALKVIAPHMAAEPSAVERFKREIQLSTQVSHPNVLRVYDLGESDGLRFLTMQYVEGESLSERMRRERPTPVLRAVAIFRQVCEGLAAAHAKGILHRDLKPQNVLVDASGGVYLSDFGLATSASLSPMTRTGAVLGTPQYMSPEQVKGEALDVRSDIFTLGIILYEMLTGVLPYAGETPNEVMFRRTQAAPRSASALNPEIPARLQRVLDRCLAVDPKLRYGSVPEILADLDSGDSGAITGPGPAAPPAARDGATSSRVRALVVELRRRKVLTTALAYLVAAFGLLQGLEIVVRMLELPPVLMTIALVVLGVGLVVSLVLSWFLDLWPEATQRPAPGPAPGVLGAPARLPALRRPASVLVAVLALVALALATWRLWPRTAASPKPQIVLIADMDNRTGEPVFDGTLEPALGIALEGASFVTTYNRGSARSVADQLRLQGTGLTETRARLVAQREGIHVVTAGSVERDGAKYRVAVRAVDAFTGKSIADRVEEASGKEAVLGAVSKLAARVRHALGDATPEAVQLKEAETFSASSIEAAHEYGVARNLERDGNYEGAKSHFLEAVRLDPTMGRAWVGLMNIEGNRGRHTAAERYFQQAMAHLDRMSEREKYRSRGAYYLQTRDADKAIEALSVLVKEFPADSSGLANLAVAYHLRRDFGRALDVGRQASAIYPRNVPQRNNVGLFAMYAGRFEEAIREQQAVVEVGPSFVNGYIGLALAQLAAGEREAALATWGRLQGRGDEGAAAAAEGLADLAIYEGRLADARALLERGIGPDLARKDGDAAARKLVMLAEAELAAGATARAAAAATRALSAARGDDVTFGAARVLVQTGEDSRALALADDLFGRPSPDARMYAEIVRGEVELKRRNPANAIARLKGASEWVDSWLVRLALGRAYLEAGEFAQALSELEGCERRRGEATDVFLDVIPTYRLYPQVQYLVGRARDGLRSPSAVDAYRAFLSTTRSDEPLVVAEVRARLARP
jgi:tetratricopeptide (TPR) repeat protein/predicted Ser/Thr protein kinase